MSRAHIVPCTTLQKCRQPPPPKPLHQKKKVNGLVKTGVQSVFGFIKLFGHVHIYIFESDRRSGPSQRHQIHIHIIIAEDSELHLLQYQST